MTTTAGERYRTERRQELTEAHLNKYGGVYRPEEFLAEATNPAHDAHDYFEWDDNKAGHEYRLWQARQFIRFTIREQDVRHSSSADVTFSYRPALVSPVENRHNQIKRGYLRTDTPEGRSHVRGELANTFENHTARRTAFLTDCERGLVETLVKSLRT